MGSAAPLVLTETSSPLPALVQTNRVEAAKALGNPLLSVWETQLNATLSHELNMFFVITIKFQWDKTNIFNKGRFITYFTFSS